MADDTSGCPPTQRKWETAYDAAREDRDRQFRYFAVLARIASDLCASAKQAARDAEHTAVDLQSLVGTLRQQARRRCEEHAARVQDATREC